MVLSDLDCYGLICHECYKDEAEERERQFRDPDTTRMSWSVKKMRRARILREMEIESEELKNEEIIRLASKP